MAKPLSEAVSELRGSLPASAASDETRISVSVGAVETVLDTFDGVLALLAALNWENTSEGGPHEPAQE